MNRGELADFLRRARARLDPSDVGLTAGARRRTPGLRREEVAHLAGMSVDYYTRLEQSRGPRPSRQMVTALARALRLTEDERDHLFHLTGEQPPRQEATSTHVRPGLLLVLDRLHDTPAMVVTDCGEVLAQNALSRALSGDVLARPPRGRNMIRRFFLDPAAQELFPPEDRPERAREQVAGLRAVASARPTDPGPASSSPNYAPPAKSSPASGTNTRSPYAAPARNASGTLRSASSSSTARSSSTPTTTSSSSSTLPARARSRTSACSCCGWWACRT